MFLQGSSICCALAFFSAAHANAECRFSPFSFFPDRNDKVDVSVVLKSGDVCSMGFKEGPSYKFTRAEFLIPPPHGVLAKTGPTAFSYIPYKGYKGSDAYGIKLCAIVKDRRGCSSLIYHAEVQ